MITIPAIISAHTKSGEAPLFHTVDIIPNAGDSWLQRRFATQAVTIGGNAYTSGELFSITRINETAKELIKYPGGIAKPEAVTVRLTNKDDLASDLAVDTLTNRRVDISLGVIPPNVLENSSFENYSGTPDNFDWWTEFRSGGGGAVGAETASPYHGSANIRITGGAARSYVFTPQIEMLNGQRLTISFYARRYAAGTPADASFALLFGPKWWDGGTGFNVAQTWLTTALTASWVRYEYNFEWALWENAGEAHAISNNIVLFFGSPDDAEFDAMQAEFNQRATLYSPCKTELETTDILKRFRGRVKQQKWRRDQIEVNIESIANDHYVELPIAVINNDCCVAAVNWEIPEASYGKPFPMSYGIFSGQSRYYWDPRLDKASDRYKLALAHVVNIDPDIVDGVQIFWDRPGRQANSYSGIGATPQIWTYVEHAKHFYKERYNDAVTPLDPEGNPHIAHEFVLDYTTSRAYQHANAYWLLLKRFAASLYWIVSEYRDSGSTGTINNPATASDADVTTGASLTGNHDWWIKNVGQSHDIGQKILLYVYPIVDWRIIAGGFINVKVNLLNMLFADTFTKNVTIVSAAIADWINCPWGRTVISPALNQKETAISLYTPASADRYYKKVKDLIDRLETRWEIEHNSADDNSILRECGLRIDFSVDLIGGKFAYEGGGRAWDATHGGRHSVGAVIQNAEYVIEDILYESGFVDADIDTTSFDAVPFSMQLTGQIVEKSDVLENIEIVAKNAHLLYFVSGAGTHKVKDMHAYHYRMSAFTPSVTLREQDFVVDSIKCSYSNRDDVANSFEVFYNRHPYEDKYSGYLYINRASDNMGLGATYQAICQNSYDALGGVEKTMRIEAPWIYYFVNGQWLATALLYWNTFQKIIIEGNLFYDNVRLELGDIVQVDLPPPYIPSGTPCNYFVVAQAREKRSESRIGVKLIQLRADLPDTV